MHNTQSEKAYLATILNNPELYTPVLSANDFYMGDEETANTRKLFNAILALSELGKDFTDIVILGNQTGWKTDYLKNFYSYPHEPKNVDEYVSQIKTATEHRRFNEHLTSLQKEIRADKDRIGKMNAFDAIFTEMRQDTSSNSNHIRDVAQRLKEKMYTDRHIPLEDRLVKSGFYDYDHIIGGYYRGQASVLAARPGMGKTALVSQIRMGTKRPTANFILETSPEELLEREISNMTGISIREIKELTFFKDPSKEILVNEALGKISQTDTYLYGSDYTNFLKLKDKLRELANLGVEMVVVDFLQTMTYSERSREGRPQELSNIIQELAQFAASDVYNKPHILVISQLNRSCEQRNDKRPELSDLKGSGGTEEFAHQITMLYRDSYYDSDTDRKTDLGDIIELIVRKNRNGATGAVDLIFNKSEFKFHNMARDNYDNSNIF